jgi:N-methylhydantoinase A
MGFRIPVDTGGSFTNVSVADDDGVLHVANALTDVEHASRSMEEGLLQLASGLGPTVQEPLARTDVVTYGTTRATNAIVEGCTARTAFFTAEGFPDVLLREDGKLEPFRQLHYMPPYVPRFLTLVRERIDLEGDVFVPLDEASLVAAIGEARELGEEAVAVCLDDSLIVDDQQTALLRSR